MDDARTKVRLRKKKTVVLDFFKAFCVSYKQKHEGVGPTFNFTELCELPTVEALLEDKDVSALPETFLSELEVELAVIVEGRAENFKAECIALVNDERKKLGLLPFGSACTEGDSNASPSSSKVQDVPTTDCPLLAASTTFSANIHWMQYDLSFQKVMESYFDRPYPEYLEYGRHPLPWKMPEFQKSYAECSETVLLGLGLPFNVTAKHMDGIAGSFVCRTCGRMLISTWAGWVSHSSCTRAAYEGN